MNWRTSGDTTFAAWDAMIPADSQIKLRNESAACYNAARPYTRLCLGMLAAESSFATDFNAVPPTMHNPLNLRPRGGSGFATFNSIALCIQEWNARITDPAYAYRDTQTVADLAHIYAPAHDNNDEAQYVRTVEATITALPLAGEGAMTRRFGAVPHPPFLDHPITKAEGHGQNNLGKRSVKGVVWHRMIGTLFGTDSYFQNGSVNALTDYGVGVAVTDGTDNDGVIIRWNNPLGYQSGWASGPVSEPYGDGKAFLDKYGGDLDIVNRDQVSIEISGNYDTELSDNAKHAIAALTAYWADQYRIPWDQFPIAPQDGFSFVRWHQEFTIGTGKICPGPVVIAATPELIALTTAIMKQYQDVVVVDPPKPPTPPKPAGPTYPKDMSRQVAEERFGRVKKSFGDFKFDENGPVSQAWLALINDQIKPGQTYRDATIGPLTSVIRRGKDKRYIDFGFSGMGTIRLDTQTGKVVA